MIPLALLPLLRRVPGIAWAFAFLVVLAVGALLFTYRAGHNAGEADVHRITLQDSVDKAVAVVERTTVDTERERRQAKKLRDTADTSRLTRERLRNEVEPLLASLPEPVVKLIEQDDAQIRRDFAAIVQSTNVETAFVMEREARIVADSLRAHQVVMSIPTHTGRKVVWAILGVGAVVGATVLIAGAR